MFQSMSKGKNSNVTVVRDDSGRGVRASGPGLVDLQINGYAGADFNAPPEEITAERLRPALERMRQRGVVAVLATLITDAIATMVARAERIVRLQRQDELVGSMIAGFHIEGPMISPDDGPRGAHPAAHTLAPVEAPGFFDDIQAAANGQVRILTLAPELGGAMELIARASAAATVVALGHHSADAATIAEAVAAGASMCTHLGNGSHAMLPRLDNYVQHQLACDQLWAGFIADGHHVPFPTLKNFLRAKCPQRSVLVTDAISAADAPPGHELAKRVDPDGAVRLEGTPYLAGSALTLDMAILNVANHCDVSFETAWTMASTQPAQLVGLPAPETVEAEITEMGFRLCS